MKILLLLLLSLNVYASGTSSSGVPGQRVSGESQPVVLPVDQTAIPISTITGPIALPTGAATASKQDDQTAQLITINGHLTTLEGYLDGVETKLDTGNSFLSTIATNTTAANTKLDTVNSNLVTIQGKQDAQTTQLTAINSNTDGIEALITAGNSSLSSIDSDFNVQLSSRASEATLALFLAANHTDLLGVQTRIDTVNTNLVTVQGKQDSQTTQLTAINANTDGLETLTGSVTETAPASDTASSGLNGRLQRVAQNLTTANGKLDTVNTNLGTVQSKQDSQTTQLTAINSNTDDLETRIGATNETVAVSDTSTSGLNGLTKKVAQNISLAKNSIDTFASANHTDTLGVQSRIDTSNTSLSSIASNTSTTATNTGTTATNTTTANTLLGSVTETAPASDTASSGLNGRLQRIAQRLTSLIAFFNLDFGASSGAIRTASQIGNATGVASFGAGTTSAQTLRVVLPTDQSQVPTGDVLATTGVAPTTVSVNNTATLVSASNADNRLRMIKNDAIIPIFCGFTNAVTASNGQPTNAGGTYIEDKYSGDIYCIYASGSSTVRVQVARK